MKSINIPDDLHRELKIYAARNKNTIQAITQSMIRDLISQKPSENVGRVLIPVPKKNNIPFE